jgi:hypothetical protein
MNNPKRYVGIYNDEQGGMTNIAKMIRDAWLFDLIPETETCEGWLPTQLQVLYEGVHAAWGPSGHIPSKLNPALQEKYFRIQAEAIKYAREHGWNPELGDDD